MLGKRNIFRVTLPIVRRIRLYREDMQSVEQLLADRIGAFAVLMGEDDARFPFKLIPCPALMRFITDVAPELVGFGMDDHINPRRGTSFQVVGIGTVDVSGIFFFNSALWQKGHAI